MIVVPKKLIRVFDRFISFFTQKEQRPAKALYGLFSIFFAVTILATAYDIYLNNTQYHETLESRIKRFEAYFKTTLDGYEQLGKNTAAIFSLTRDVELQDWNYFVAKATENNTFPALTLIAMIQQVQTKDLDAFKAYEQRLNNRNLEFQHIFTNEMNGIVRYLTPLLRKIESSFEGYNIFSIDPKSVPIFMETLSKNKVLVNYPKIVLSTLTPDPSIIQIVVPVYYNPQNKERSYIQSQDTIGWVILGIHMEHLLKDVQGVTPWLEPLKFKMVPSNTSEKPIFDSTNADEHIFSPHIHTFTFLNTTWKFTFYQKSQYINILGLPFSVSTFVIIGIGILLSFLMMALFWAIINTRTRAYAIADQISNDLQKQESKHRRLIANAPGVIFSCDPNLNWKMTYLSDQFETLTGYVADEFIENKGRAYIDLVYNKDIQGIERKIGFVPKPGSMYFHEYRIYHSDGSLRWIHERARVVRDEDTGDYYLTGSFFDVSEQKRKEAENRILTNALENAVDGIAFLDRNGVFQKVNDAFARMFGKTTQQFTRINFKSLVHERDRIKLEKATAELISHDRVVLNIEAIGLNESRLFLSVVLVPALKDASEQQLMGYYCFAKDISRDTERELQLSDAVRAAEAANQTKSTFLATMSHELRTPLNAIIGYSDMILEDCEDLGLTQQKADLQKINGAGRHLLTLINDILDVSKLEAGKMTLHFETFDIGETCRSIMDMMYPSAEKNQNTLVLECPEDVGQMYSDMTKLRQSLFNLLSNATKFTKDGTITLKVLNKIEDGTDNIYFSVSDTGIGITEEQIERLFQPFTQADSSTTRNFGGTGLGLTITKRFCELLGGDCRVASTVGEGTTFTLVLPRQSKVSAEHEPPKQSNAIAS